jgi:hypothetical protein
VYSIKGQCSKLNRVHDADELKQFIIKICSERKPQSLRQLAAMVKEIRGTSEGEVFEAAMDLENQGKIELSDKQTIAAPNLGFYVKSANAAWFWVTVAVAAFTVITVFVIPVDAYPFSILRNVFGIVFVLWLPGFTFIKALFPSQLPFQTSSESLDLIERVALSIGLSLALTPMVGLVLNYTPWGIRLVPVTLSLLALTLVFAVVALVREFQAKTVVLGH